jgi:hypothetical protein
MSAPISILCYKTVMRCPSVANKPLFDWAVVVSEEGSCQKLTFSVQLINSKLALKCRNPIPSRQRYFFITVIVHYMTKPRGNRVKPTLFKVSSTFPAEMRIDRIPRIIRLLLYTLIHILKRVIFDQHTILLYFRLSKQNNLHKHLIDNEYI